MPGYSCPHCRGELVDDSTNNRWHITLSTTTSIAAGLDDGTFAIDVVVSGASSNHQQGLAQNSGVAGGDGRTTYSWSITRPGAPVSGTLAVTHDSLGLLQEVLVVS